VRADATLDEVLGEVHHFAEAVIHHRKPAIGAKHAQPMRHVVQRGIELAGQCRFAVTRRQCFDEDGVQAEVDILETDEKQHQQRGEADVIEIAMQRQRQRHRPACQQDVILDQLGTAVVAGRAAGGVTDRHRDTHHVRDRVVVGENGEKAPDAEHAGIHHGAGRIARLQISGLLERQHLGAPLIFAHLEGADSADRDDEHRTRPQQLVAGLERREYGGDGGADRADEHWPEILAHGIDQRRVERGLRLFPATSFFRVDQLHRQGTHPVRVRSSTLLR
jgi:hypothetical protein